MRRAASGTRGIVPTAPLPASHVVRQSAASSPLLVAETPGKGPQKESSQCKPGSDEDLHPPSLDSLKSPQSFNSHAFSLVICFDNITPRAHKFLAGERHSSTLRSCAALEPNLSESREIRFFRRSLPAAKVSAEQARKCMPTRMRARGTGQWWHILARSTMEFPVRQRQPTIWPWSRRFAPQ